MNRKTAILSVLLLSAWLAGCASSGPPQPESVNLQEDSALKSGEVESPARSSFFQAERLFKAKKYKNAIDGYRSIKKRFPGGRAHQISSYRLGSIFYLSNKYPQASQEFQSFLQTFPKSELAFDVTYNLAASEYQQGHYDKAFEALRRLSADEVRAQGPRRAEVVYQLGAQTAAALGNHAAAITYYAAYLQVPIEDGKRRSIENGIGQHLNQMNSPDDLNALMAQLSEPGTRGRIAERLAALSGGAAATTTGAPTMEGVAPLGSMPGTSTAGAGLASPTSGDRTHVGVVLPLSGPLAPYGRRALDGILLAAGVYRREGGSDFEIFVEDSGSNPALAAQGVERLYQDHNVIAVIGPISWKESIAAGDMAQELGVLNLSLSGKEGISERGAYLFQNALTPRVQMENLVKHAIQEKRLRRFAILAPNNAFGDDMATEFAAVAKKLGGKIVGYESYSPDAKDFQEPVQKLTGLADPRYRKMENQRLEQFAREQQEKTRRPSKARLPPIVDFDAIFLPDGPKNAAQIAASLAYFDVSGVTLLGTSEWNSDQLYKRGGRLVEGAIFPGGLSLSSSSPRQKDFIRLYAEAYGTMPDLLATQAFEAVELVARAAGASSGNRNNAVSELMSLNRFESPLGQLSFDQSRIALRKLPILSLEPGGNIVEQ